MMTKRLLSITLGMLLFATTAHAQTVRKVCASGTSGTGDDTYTNAQLQTAINDSVGGDTILLQQGFEYVGTFTWPTHTGASYVEMRTGVASNCSVVSTTSWPATNVRVTPTSATTVNPAVLRANANNASALKTADAVGGVSPKFWRSKFIKYASNISTDWLGSGALVTCGSDDNTLVPDYTAIASDFEFIQNWFAGDPVTGQFRGLALLCGNATVKDNYFDNIKSKTEGQALWCNSFEATATITNNYFSGGTEIILCGGSSGAGRPNITVSASPTPTTTTATLSANTGLRVGKSVTFNVAGVEQQADIVSCGTSTFGALCTSTAVTFTALSAAPDSPGDVDWGLSPSINFTKNYVTRPLALRDPVLGIPQSVTATASATGGTLAAGTYGYRVVARLKIASSSSDNMAVSGASVEVSATTTGTTSSVQVCWASVANATEYRVYGRQPGAENTYFTVTAPTTCYTDTNSAGTAGSVPTSTGTLFYVKNLFELKNCDGCTVEDNIFENTWFMTGGQYYAITLTPANGGGNNDSTVVRNLTFRYNIIRRAPGGISICGRMCSTVAGDGDASGRMTTVTITHNLLYDINSSWGGSVNMILISTANDSGLYASGQALGPKDLTIEHNTFDGSNGSLLNLDLYKGAAVRPVDAFIYRNNLAKKQSYGIFGANSCTQGSGCWTTYTTGSTVYNQNVIAGASCGSYPSGTLCPTTTALESDYTSYAGLNFLLKTTSAYHNAATDGTDIGADIGTLNTRTAVAISGDNTGGGGTPVTPPSITTSSLPDGQRESLYGGSSGVSIAGVCPSTPCTWSASGLPTGTSIATISSTEGRITGTLSAAGSFSPLVTITDSGARTGTRTYTVTVLDIPQIIDNRLSRYNLDEGVIFRRATDPCADGEPVRVGDFWGDTSATPPVMKINTQLSPSCVWNPISSNVSTVTMQADDTSFTWTNQPSAENELNATLSRVLVFDTTLYRSFRWTLRVQGASASANTPKCYVKYASVDTGHVAATDTIGYTTLTGTDISLATAGSLKSSWVDLPDVARADLFWRIFCSGGDGVADPAFGLITFQFRQ